MAADTGRHYVPLTCHGHSRPVPHISFSPLTKDDMYYMISACKGEMPAQLLPGQPFAHARVHRWKPHAPRRQDGRLVGRAVLALAPPDADTAGITRIGTFIGHKGAVWQAKLSHDASTAATASADFTA